MRRLGRRARPRPAASALLAIALVAAGCGITTDDVPRDVDQSQRKDLSPVVSNNAGAATGAGRIYVLAPGAQGSAARLVSVPRDVPDDPEALLQTLMAGLNEDERADQLSTAIPDGTEVLSARQVGSVLVVDLSEAGAAERMSELRSVRAIAAVAQIVFTASEISSVSSVQLQIDGARQSWPGGDGELQSEPLSVYDFPGMVDSAQPDYPPIPSD